MNDIAEQFISRFAVFCVGVFAVSALINLMILVNVLAFGRRGSMLFVFGGLFGAVGFLLVPTLRRYAWLPPLIEPATVLFLSYGLPALLLELWRTSSYNLVSSYGAKWANRQVWLRLYRKQVCTLKQSFSRPPGEYGVTESSNIGTWRWEVGRLVVDFGDHTTSFEPVVLEQRRLIRQVGGNPSDETFPELSLAGVELTCETIGQP